MTLHLDTLLHRIVYPYIFSYRATLPHRPTAFENETDPTSLSTAEADKGPFVRTKTPTTLTPNPKHPDNFQG